MLRDERRLKTYYKSLAESVQFRRQIYDELVPKWKACTTHHIGFADLANPSVLSLDIVTELPGRIFVRGWDETGVIHNLPSCKDRATRRQSKHLHRR